MGQEEREKYIQMSQEHMTEEEYQAFQEFRKKGNRHLEENGSADSMPWTTCFITFINMMQVFGDFGSRIDFSKPFRTVIDYDPEQVRVAIHHYSTENSSSSIIDCNIKTKGENNMNAEKQIEFMERKKHNEETSVKIARILAESRAVFTDVDEILNMSKKHLMVTFDAGNRS